MASTLEALSNDLALAVERAGRAVVAIHARRRIPASGILWRPGLVVAADHTVHKDDDVRVTLADGTDVRAAVAGRDPSTDLCVLRLPDGAAPEPATIARAALRVGQLVLALGRPGPAVTASLGIVSAVGPEWRTWRGGRVDQFVRLDVAIYDGFSGDPLADVRGRVLGVNAMIVGGLGVAVSADEARRVLRAGAPRPRLDATLRPVAVRLPGAPDTLATGLLVLAAAAGGSADRAGIIPGDVLLGHAGRPFRGADDLLDLLRDAGPGATLRLDVGRAGRRISVTVELRAARAERRAA